MAVAPPIFAQNVKNKMSKIILNKWFISFLILLIFGSAFSYLSRRGEKVIQIENDNKNTPEATIFENINETPTAINKSSISGLECENYNRRPIAVVLAEDSIARPLSGISQADLVVEMPVITGGITRMVAFFQCQSPKEIGSVRSARHDFIPLVMGLDAILVHWGGSHYALNKLNKGVMDNIDALTNPYQAFWRKKGIPAPYNGFTSTENLLKVVKNKNYRLSMNFDGYSHLTEDLSSQSQILNKGGSLEIGYVEPYDVSYQYEPKANSYLRWRNGSPEMDKADGKQVEVKNIVVMTAFSRQLEIEYNDLDIEGEGRIAVYQNGEETKGSWQKNKTNLASKLYFFDKDGKEIDFVPGKIWIEIVEPYQKVEWKTQEAQSQ